MTQTVRRLVLAAAAASFFVVSAVAQQVLSRDDVRTELAQARAEGLLDHFGDAGASDDVVAARAQFNATQALVMAAQQAYERRRADRNDRMPDLASYVEEGPDGPVFVLMLFEADGSLHSSDAVTIASND